MNLTASQKRRVGILIMIISLPIQLILLVASVYFFAVAPGENNFEPFSMLFGIGLFSFLLHYGWRQWTEGTRQMQALDIEVDPLTHLFVNTKIDLESYRRLMVVLTLRHPIILFLYLVGITTIAGFLISSNGNTWWLLFIILFLAYLPLGVYRRAKSNFNATKALHDPVQYEFTTSQIISKGETFNSTMQWSTIHKAQELKNWFLLYCNKESAIVIPKASFGSVQDLETFRMMSRKLVGN